MVPDSEQQSVATLPDFGTGSADAEHVLDRLRATIGSIEEMSSAAKVALDAANASKDSVAELSASTQELLLQIQGAATQALASKTAVLDAQAVIATKSDHIEDARKHADEVRAELDRALTAATQHATEAEGLKARTQTATDAASTLLAGIQTSKGLVDADVLVVKESRESSVASSAGLKTLSDKAATVEQKIAEYEKRLASLEAQCAEQLQTITGLLPGATSAGLAHAFDARRMTFLSPAGKWQWIFVGSLGALVALALTGMYHVYNGVTVISYDELARLWLARLPVAGALIWLALHASRESALAKRLEEDYGYKAAISSSFLGFNKQMKEIGEAAGPMTPLAQLCTDTLATIANPPGRIYEKHSLVVSPSSELAETAKAVLPSN